MASLIKQFVCVYFLIQFTGLSAHAITCKSVIGGKPLTINVIVSRIEKGVAAANKGLESLVPNGVLDGYYTAVALGFSPRRAQENILRGSRVHLHSNSTTDLTAQAYYTAVGLGLDPAMVSKRLEDAKLEEPSGHGKIGAIEGYYLAVAFGADPSIAADDVMYFGIHDFPNIERHRSLTTAFYASLAFGIDPEVAGDLLNNAYHSRGKVRGGLKKGVMSGFYFAAAVSRELYE